jgi:hypothetical protein
MARLEVSNLLALSRHAALVSMVHGGEVLGAPVGYADVVLMTAGEVRVLGAPRDDGSN